MVVSMKVAKQMMVPTTSKKVSDVLGKLGNVIKTLGKFDTFRMPGVTDVQGHVRCLLCA